ncbi:hypothetical protein [Amycolatopsis sp. NPDC051903]|uniref:hypothetical protein n=1 Tax=Amycolatopsis sp. NPDC051903 TaxID=3363936 RepID=UPI0037B5389A
MPGPLACDESGSEGDNLVGANTAVFAHAGVRLDTSAASACVAELRARIRSPAVEYKANHLLRAKNRAALVWFLGPSGPLVDRAGVLLVDKALFLTGKVVDLLVDRVSYPDCLARRPDSRAEALHRAGPHFAGERRWGEFLRSFTALLHRSPRRPGLTPQQFFTQADVLVPLATFFTTSGEGMGPVADFSPRHGGATGPFADPSGAQGSTRGPLARMSEVDDSATGPLAGPSSAERGTKAPLTHVSEYQDNTAGPLASPSSAERGTRGPLARMSEVEDSATGPLAGPSRAERGTKAPLTHVSEFQDNTTGPLAGPSSVRAGATGPLADLFATNDAPAPHPMPPAAEELLAQARSHLTALRDRLHSDPALVPPLDPLMPALADTITHWHPTTVIHDEQPSLTRARLATLLGPARSIHFVDSRTDPRVQIADFLAGTARRLAEHTLHQHGDAQLMELLRPYVLPSSIWVEEGMAARPFGQR